MAGGLKGIDPLSGRKLSVPVRRCLVIAQRDRLKISAASRRQVPHAPCAPWRHSRASSGPCCPSPPVRAGDRAIMEAFKGCPHQGA